MLSPYDWALTARVLFNLARLWPQLNDASAPLHPLAKEWHHWAGAGPYRVERRELSWGHATYACGAHSEVALPVVIFSSGAAADGTNYELLACHWASHGFCVLQPVHADSFNRRLAAAAHPAFAFLGAVWDVWGLVLGDYLPWRARLDDVTRLIDSLPAIGDELDVALDVERVGVGGYSYGAQAALYLGGARFYWHGRQWDWRDSRVRAVLAISPEPGARTVPKGVWSGLRAPCLFLTGEHDGDVLGRDWRPKAVAYRAAAAVDKGLVVLPGASHFAFSGRLLESATNPEELEAQEAIFGAVKARTLDFWLRTLGAPCRIEFHSQELT